MDAAMATVATASIMAVAKAAVGAAVAVAQAHGDGARRPGSPSDGCMVPISSDITMMHTTLTVHATAIARRVDCAKASESNELLLLSTTEPLLPAGGTGLAVLMDLIAASSKILAIVQASAR